jgi:hypothetical protein
MTITMQDLNPQKAFFIIPECRIPYTIGSNLFVATIEQALEEIKPRNR